MSTSVFRLATAILLAGAALPCHAQAATRAAAPSPDAGATADARFKAITDKEWAWRSEQLGEDDDGPGHLRAHLPDVTPKAQAARLAYWQDVRKQVAEIPADQLSPAVRIDQQVYLVQIDALIAQQQFREWEKPLNSDSSFWSDLASVGRRTFSSEDEYRRYIALMNEFPRYFHDQIANMQAGLARGFTSPHVTLYGRDDSIASVADKAAEDTAYFEPFKAMPATIPAATQAELREAGLKAIRESVIPAHKELLAYVRGKYIPGARKTLAAEALPDGKAYYRSVIKEYATTDMSPEQIHQLGLSEMAKIRAEMLETMKEAKFDGDLPAFLEFLRTDPQFYAKTPQDLLDRAAWTAKEVDRKVGRFIGHLPRQRFGIIPVPADIAPFYTAGRGGPGVYLVNTYDMPSRPLYSLPALTLHESAPGHAFQMPVAAENKDQPDFRRGTYISAFGEGWALYCERLGTEMGIYQTPYEKFGMLSYQAWRAARLVVDTGVHHYGWTRERAQQYLYDNTALSNHEIETEVDRYIAWPGQALSYYLGEMAIMDGRHKAEAALGPKFNIRAFHDTVLALGSVPLPVLSARIDQFIAEGGKGPYPDEES
ncbi:uncharacterized protein (DUF885 family) [Novosphingobium sp. PhB165]|uniref:DUF885 domain-containing protein n=1 Tax=Novosphingobium sp. PhB165 TaxID=2485105 RepID=UPI0010D6862D|nr:DUF885 family protein [Novosphingobium sp. PhB165]TCM17674.1 uncharacterized protein (DUF885 family) [Novosphingobium sp. PhB165]